MGSRLAEKAIKVPYTVPGGYFTGLNDVLAEIVAGKETTGQLPYTEVPYTVPAHYFDALPGLLAEKVEKKKKRGILITFGQLRWAAAAVVFLTIGLGSYNMIQGNSTAAKDVFLSNIADNEIQEYLAATSGHIHPEKSANDACLEKANVDSKDIIAYLDETGWQLD